ncbi:hypothetical protein IAD21_04971 [Abditibacteriota bacterium]|nr:hypothetical protein IAD21_04971 [Abditibacteriota bacterium]
MFFPASKPLVERLFSGLREEKKDTMSKDLAVLLQGWDYNPNEVTVRRIVGADGREKIQMRLDLGVLQMEISGRPDGKRPHGFESLLEYQLAQKESAESGSAEWNDWTLDSEACADLKQEAMQYYYRYLSLFHLGDYHEVIRDTGRNITVFDLIRDYAEDESDRMSLEQFRPYVLMMNARARACLSLEDKRYDRAMEIIEDGIESIRDFFRDVEREDLAESCREIQFLEEWRERIENNRPLTAADRIRRELSIAVASEDYERAAELRDQLRAIVA